MKTLPQVMVPLASVGVLALVAGTAVAAGPVRGQDRPINAEKAGAPTLSLPIRVGSGARSVDMRVENPEARESKAVTMGAQGGRAYLVTNQVLVRTTDRAALDGAVAQLGSGLSVQALGNEGKAWVVETPSVAAAAEVARRLGAMSFVSHASVGSGPWVDAPRVSNRQILNHQERVRSLTAPGVAPVGMPGGLRGGDPLRAQQWHLDTMNLPAVHARGLTGAGVTVGITGITVLSPDPDHEDYGERFDTSISQPASPAAFDEFATFYTGLIGATANNGLGGQGIAPGVRLASMIHGTPIREAQAFDWMNDEIDIKVHPRATFPLYTAPDDGYAPNLVNDYVMDALENSLRLGRGGKGTIHVFSTGFEGTFPSPYTGSGDGWQDIFDNVGEVAVGITNDYTVAPLYPGGLVHNYPPANHRNTFVFAGIGEDEFPDPFGVLGTGVLASVYSSTNNALIDPGAGRGLTSTMPEDAYAVGFVDPINGAPAAIGAGIIALMLEANPDLTIRDIQHIIARTAVVPPGFNYDFFNPYVSANPFATASGGSGTSNWGSNGEFKIHSDQYGFGLIDADAAVEEAIGWESPGQLFVLDTGLVEDVDIEIPDATHIPMGELFSVYQVQTAPTQIPFCVRQNFRVEAIEVELTIAGAAGGNDLIINLTSPYGAGSNLHYPMSVNPDGTTFDPPNNSYAADTGMFSNVSVGGTTYAFYRHTFTTYKHWDELSGGRWAINIWDVGPADQLEEGEEPQPPEPGEDHVTNFGFPLAVPPNPDRDEKTIESYRIRIYGTETGLPVFTGCVLTETSCPADLNGDGVVNTVDLQLFLEWYMNGDLRADVNGDGDIDFQDIVFYRSLWIPGFCTGAGSGTATGGRPINPPSGGNDSTPIVRPI